MARAVIVLQDAPAGVNITANFDPELQGQVPESHAQNLGVHLFQIGQSRAEEGDFTKDQPHACLSSRAIDWLSTGERSAAANALFTRLTGVDACGENDKAAHPFGVEGFKQCQRLLDACPELNKRLAFAKSISPVWSTLVDNWQLILGTLEDEDTNWGLPINRSRFMPTPLTAQIIQNIVRRFSGEQDTTKESR